MDNQTQLEQDRVRNNTPESLNRKIDNQTEINIIRYAAKDKEEIEARILNLEKEWDTERTLEITSGINVLLGLTLGLTVNKKWFLLSAVSAAFLVQHAIQGWCPPLPVIRALGVRTKNEMDVERKALQAELAS